MFQTCTADTLQSVAQTFEGLSRIAQASPCLLCAASCAAVRLTGQHDPDDISSPVGVSGDEYVALQRAIDGSQDQQQLDNALRAVATQLGVAADGFVKVVTDWATFASAATGPQSGWFGTTLWLGHAFQAALELFASSKAGQYSTTQQMFLDHMVAPVEDAAGKLLSGLCAYMLSD